MIEISQIKRMADLARIRMSDKEAETMRADIDTIVGFVAHVEHAVGDYKPTQREVYNVMREDTDPHESGIYSDALLEEAPKIEGRYIRVKKIL